MHATNNLIEHRTHALATVVLTRRKDTLVSEIQGDPFLDLFVHVFPAKSKRHKGLNNTMYPFACILK